MSSSVARTSKYSYRSSGAAAGNIADVSIEYSADLSALSRLEVIYFYTADQPAPTEIRAYGSPSI